MAHLGFTRASPGGRVGSGPKSHHDQIKPRRARAPGAIDPTGDLMTHFQSTRLRAVQVCQGATKAKNCKSVKSPGWGSPMTRQQHARDSTFSIDPVPVTVRSHPITCQACHSLQPQCLCLWLPAHEPAHEPAPYSSIRYIRVQVTSLLQHHSLHSSNLSLFKHVASSRHYKEPGHSFVHFILYSEDSNCPVQAFHPHLAPSSSVQADVKFWNL